MSDNLIPIGKFAKLIGVSTQTLRRWNDEGKLIPEFCLPNSNKRFYSKDQLNTFRINKPFEKDKFVIGYCRVSSKKQVDDLKRQVDCMKSYLISNGKPFIIIEDIGSGINYNKDGLKELLHKVINGEVEKIVVLYKDRLVRFGFELIEEICSLFNVKIEIIDNSEKDDQTEFVEDIIQIITVYSAKLNRKRKYSTKKIIEELNELQKQKD